MQQDLAQPIYPDNPAPQARSTTFAPPEVTQRQAAPVQTATDSALILDQATTRIPVQYDARATTPGGSVSVDMVSAEELKQNLIANVEKQSTGLRDLATITLEELKPAMLRALNIKRMAGNTVTGFLGSCKQAFIEDILQDKADLEIAQALFRTDSLAQAIEQEEHLYQAAVKPYLDETKQSLEDFKRLPWQEQYRIVIGNIFEQATTAVLFHTANRYIPVVLEKLPKLVQFISEDKPLSIAQTADGVQFVFETTPEFGNTPEAAILTPVN